MSLLLLSFLAGILSVLAPCVLPVLPVILGGSLGTQKRYRPLIIVTSTAVCIVLFTLLLKVSTALIGIPQYVRTLVSSVIIILYGVTLLRPTLWERIAVLIGANKANSLVTAAKMYTGIRGDVLLGASLGPIFASCSPTYALLLSVVFPHSILAGIGYTSVYAFGFGLLLLALAYGGRALIQKISRAANPSGWFKKVLGGLLVVTGILIATGRMKKLEVAILDAGFFDVGRYEQSLLQGVDLPDSQQRMPTRGDADRSANSCSSGVCAKDANDGSASKISSHTASLLDSNHPGKRFLNANAVSPELLGLTNRINSDTLTLAKLRGKVVIIDFRTYSCINCIRTLPYIQTRHETYADKGLVIIGVHAPEFQFEKNPKNVQSAVKEHGLTYPIALDNDFATRQNFNNRYRPAKYIIDRDGVIRYTHFGEGGYMETEEVIQYLLGLSASDATHTILYDEKKIGGSTSTTSDAGGRAYTQTPETYLGSLRANPDQMPRGGAIDVDQRWFDGTRSQKPEHQILTSSTGTFHMKFYASQINLVMGNTDRTSQVEVVVDGVVIQTLSVSHNTLYPLRQGVTPGLHTIELRVTGKGLQTYALTFG